MQDSWTDITQRKQWCKNMVEEYTHILGKGSELIKTVKHLIKGIKWMDLCCWD